MLQSNQKWLTVCHLMAVDNYHQIVNCTKIQTCQTLQLHLLASEPCVRPLVPVRSKEAFESASLPPPPTEVPKTKKRKKSSKQELLSPLETGTSPILPPPPPPPLVSKSFVPDKKTDGSKKSSLSGLVEPEDGQVVSQSSSHTDTTASKTLEPAKKRTMKRNYLKPHNGCELHMKSIDLLLLSQAVSVFVSCKQRYMLLQH